MRVKQYNRHRSEHAGFTLIELMVTIAVMAIIVSIAIPAYVGYVAEARFGTARANANTIRVFMEEHHLENNTYVGNVSAPPYDEVALENNYNWRPDGDNNAYTYTVNAAANDWSVTVEHTNSRDWIRCENRMTRCCDSETPGATRDACP